MGTVAGLESTRSGFARRPFRSSLLGTGLPYFSNNPGKKKAKRCYSYEITNFVIPTCYTRHFIHIPTINIKNPLKKSPKKFNVLLAELPPLASGFHRICGSRTGP